MSLLQKDEIMEIIQKGNSKNILRRIIKSKNHHKFTDTKEIIIPEKKNSKNFTINDYYSNLDNNLPHNLRVVSSKKAANANSYINNGSKNIINKLSTTNTNIINSNLLNELNHYDSSSTLRRGAKKKHHSIYISGMNDSPLSKYINNLEKEKYDKDANYMHIMPVNKLTSYSTNKTTMLYKKRLEPEKITQNTSYIYTSVHNLTQNINNKNIINNFIIDSNAYRNSNVDKIKPLSEIKTNFEYLNDSKTYNSKRDKYSYLKLRNNDIYSPNTLNPIKELNRGNINSYRLRKNDGMSHRKLLSVNNSSIGSNFFFNPLKQNNFMTEINDTTRNKDKSKDKDTMNKSPNITSQNNKNNYLRNNEFYKDIKVSNTITNTNTNSKVNYRDRRQDKKENNIINRIKVNQKFKRKIEDKYLKGNFKLIPNKMKLEDIKKILRNKNKEIEHEEEKNSEKEKNTKGFYNKNYTYYGDYKNKKSEKEDNYSIKQEKHKRENDTNNDKDKMKLNLIKDYTEKLKMEKEKNNEEKKNLVDNLGNNDIKLNMNNIYDEQNLKTIEKINVNKIKSIYKKVKKKKKKKKKKIQKSSEQDNVIETHTENNIESLNESMENANQLSENKQNQKLTAMLTHQINPKISEKIKSALNSDKCNILKKKIYKLSLSTRKDSSNTFTTRHDGEKHFITIPSSIREELKKDITNSPKSDINKNKYNNEEEKQSISNCTNTNTTSKLNNLNNNTYLETKNIKNVKKDTFLTLYSGWRLGGESRFDDSENLNYTCIDNEFEEYKPYVSKHPGKIFKKRGNAYLKSSEKKKSMIKLLKINNKTMIKYFNECDSGQKGENRHNTISDTKSNIRPRYKNSFQFYHMKNNSEFNQGILNEIN